MPPPVVQIQARNGPGRAREATPRAEPLLSPWFPPFRVPPVTPAPPGAPGLLPGPPITAVVIVAVAVGDGSG
jgi:hypothetical protein